MICMSTVILYTVVGTRTQRLPTSGSASLNEATSVVEYFYELSGAVGSGSGCLNGRPQPLDRRTRIIHLRIDWFFCFNEGSAHDSVLGADRQPVWRVTVTRHTGSCKAMRTVVVTVLIRLHTKKKTVRHGWRQWSTLDETNEHILGFQFSTCKA